MRRICGWQKTRAETMPCHYQHVRRWARRYVECQDPGLVVSHKKLYGVLRARLKPGEVSGVPKEVWGRVQAKGLGNRLNDLNWLVALNRLPVRDTLYRHGISRNGFCPRNTCFREETVDHALWGCAFAQKVWENIIGRFPVLRGLSQRAVLFGEGLQGFKGREGFVVLLVVSLVKKALWDARCLAARCNVEGKVEGVVGWVRLKLGWRFRLEEERWGFHAAKEKWKSILGGLE